MAHRSDFENPARLFYRPRTLAKALGVSPGLIYRDLRSGRLRGRQLHRAWLIDPADAERWLERESRVNVERPEAA